MLGSLLMSKKTSKRRSPRSRSAPSQAPLLKTVLRGILKFFEEDLPVTEFTGAGKFDTEVAGVKNHQAALEAICGGRSLKPQKHMLRALVTPVPTEKTMRVEIERKVVGQLKPADAKFLQKQLDAAEVGPCALRVSALIQGGRRKKNGEEEDFTVALCLPPRPEKKVPVPKPEALQPEPSKVSGDS